MLVRVIKKTKLDLILVGTIMTAGFLVVLGKLSGIWPCDFLINFGLQTMNLC